ncbi:MAG: ATP-binding cassette domain-containing protein [Acidobacteria bacterium]|nr:MAG: ATP-binding cassette domain-containing protein [Acidobacteriota bacterium]
MYAPIQTTAQGGDRVELLLKVESLTKVFGRGCEQCLSLTGKDGNRCPICGSIVACADVSFELHRGEWLGILGESGSGKSTLLRLLNLELEPTKGRMLVNLEPYTGLDLLSISPYSRRLIRQELFGIVYQNPIHGLRMEVSAGGNVAERLILMGERRVEKIRERVLALFRRLELPEDRMDELPSSFSGGMQQRLQIAKAIVNNPPILLLDEFTTGLDPSVQAGVLELLKEIMFELGISAIVVSHDIGVINFMTHRVLVMNRGRVVEHGLTDQILEDPQDPYTQTLVHSKL